ncbi:hypothetical protein CAAR111675_08185 [Campylobacter armoricus]
MVAPFFRLILPSMPAFFVSVIPIFPPNKLSSSMFISEAILELSLILIPLALPNKLELFFMLILPVNFEFPSNKIALSPALNLELSKLILEFTLELDIAIPSTAAVKVEFFISKVLPVIVELYIYKPASFVVIFAFSIFIFVSTLEF